MNQPFPAGGMEGTVSPPAGSGAEPRRQTHFGNNLLKSGLKQVSGSLSTSPKELVHKTAGFCSKLHNKTKNWA